MAAKQIKTLRVFTRYCKIPQPVTDKQGYGALFSLRHRGKGKLPHTDLKSMI